MDRGRLRPARDVKRNCLMRVAAEATDLKIEVAGINRVTERWRWLGRPLEGEHAFIPGFAGEPVSYLARLCRPRG
jgi:hypothetical protein